MAKNSIRYYAVFEVMASAYSQSDYSDYRGLQVLPLISERAIEDAKRKDVLDGSSTRVPQGGDFTLNIPEKCKQQGYCEEIDGYPTELVQKIIDGLSEEDMKNFRSDKLYTPQIAQRQGGDGSDSASELCEFTSKIIYPQSAPSAENSTTWYRVLNLKYKKLQGIKVEICRQVNSSCNGKIVTFQRNHSGGCKQKYFSRMLDVIDENENHVLKYVKLPCCCSCVANVGKK